MGEPNDYGGVRFEIVELAAQGPKTTKAKVKFFLRKDEEGVSWGRERTANLGAKLAVLEVAGSYFGELSWYPPRQAGYHPSLVVNMLWVRTRAGWTAIPSIGGTLSTQDPSKKQPLPVADDFPGNQNDAGSAQNATEPAAPSVSSEVREAALKMYLTTLHACVDATSPKNGMSAEAHSKMLGIASIVMDRNGFWRDALQKATADQKDKEPHQTAAEQEAAEAEKIKEQVDALPEDQSIPF